jgi:hypothetical protein
MVIIYAMIAIPITGRDLEILTIELPLASPSYMNLWSSTTGLCSSVDGSGERFPGNFFCRSDKCIKLTLDIFIYRSFLSLQLQFYLDTGLMLSACGERLAEHQQKTVVFIEKKIFKREPTRLQAKTIAVNVFVLVLFFVAGSIMTK